MSRFPKRLLSLSSLSWLLVSQIFLPAAPTNAQVFDGFVGCPAGTREGATNYVKNGDFSTNAGTGSGVPTAPAPVPAVIGFNSELPYRGDAVYPDDPIGGLSIQNGAVNYLANSTPPPPFIVVGTPFLGDPANNVPGSNTYLYSNPNASVTAPGVSGSAFLDPTIWQQVVTGLRPNASYNFTAYFYNLLANGAPGAPPIIRFLAGPPGGPDTAFVPSLNGSPVGARQQWTRVQGLFRTTAGQTSLELRIEDQANTVIGDDFGMTAVAFRECVPTLGVAKQAGTSTRNADGTYTIPYTVRVRNFAPSGSSQFDLTNLQLADNLAQTFAAATLNGVTNIQSPTLTVNPNFNGSSNQNLLQGTDTLAAGTIATITFNVNVIPGTGANGFGPFNNTATATATSQGGTNVSDQSTDGVNTDPDNDGNPGNNSTLTSVSLTPGGLIGSGGTGGLRIVKRITNVLRDGAPLSGVNFGAFVDGPGDADNAPGFAQIQPGGALIGQITIDPALTKLQSGDEIEYTVYYLSDGTGPAIGVSICDPFPLGTTLVPNTAQIRQANGAFSPGGSIYSPLAPLPNGNACPDPTNANGTVIFDLGNISNVAGDNFGLLRFRVRVN